MFTGFWNIIISSYGGWENEELVPLFKEYARVCYENFGDRVRYFLEEGNLVLSKV